MEHLAVVTVAHLALGELVAASVILCTRVSRVTAQRTVPGRTAAVRAGRGTLSTDKGARC